MKLIIYVLFTFLILPSIIFSQGLPEIVWSIQANTGSINAVSVSADGNTLLSSNVHTVKTWDRNTHALLNTYEDQSKSFLSSTISSDANLFTVGYIVGVYPDPNLGESTVFDMHSNAPLYNIPGCFTTFSNNNLIFAGTGGGLYRNVNVRLRANGSQLFEAYTGNYNNDLAISPIGDLIAIATSGNVIKIYNSQTGTLIQTIPAHTNDVRTVAFSPDGSLLASGAGGWDASGESSIKIWNTTTWDSISTLQGHDYWVDGVEFSSDGNYLISIGRDGLYPNINSKIIIWNTSDWSMNTYYDEGLGNAATTLCAIAGTDQYLFANTNGELTLAQFPLIIPVELTSFTAMNDNNSITLSWKTSTETSNSGFEVQRKNLNWERIGFVEGNGTTTEESDYSFIDNNLNSGIYQYRLKQIDYDGTFGFSEIVEVEIQSPADFSLSQNYPNPFNPSTVIKYSVSEENTLVTIEIYSSIGQKIQTLVNHVIPAGNYEVQFDAKGITSGIYFYTLKAGNFVETKKMVMMK